MRILEIVPEFVTVKRSSKSLNQPYQTSPTKSVYFSVRKYVHNSHRVFSQSKPCKSILWLAEAI